MTDPPPDLSQVPDERLVELAQTVGCRAAVGELLRRHFEDMADLVGYLSRVGRLTPADVPDARQNAVFAVLEAVRRYQAGRAGFRPFLRRVTAARFRDFRRRLRRAGRWSGPAGVGGSEWLGLSAGPEVDPAEVAARRDEARRVGEAVARLAVEDRRLCGLLADGVRLRAAATELGLSYDAARRRLRRMRMCFVAGGRPVTPARPSPPWPAPRPSAARPAPGT